jgi:lysophospholipase L1-like esterase
MSRQYVKLASSKIVFDGNSLTEGASTGAGAANISTQVSTQLIAQKIFGVSIVNVGVGGKTCAQMIADASTQVAPLFEAGRDNIIVVNEGGNDIYFGATAQQAFQNMRDYCLLRRSEGFYVLVWSAPKRNNGFSANPSGDPSGFQSALLDFNNRLASGWKEFADAFMDTREHFPYAPEANYPSNGGFWFPDCIHPSATGNAILAAKIIECLKLIPVRKREIPLAITYKFNTVGVASLTIPAGYTRMRGFTHGGSGGSGSGRKGAAGTARFGGGGASAGARNDFDLDLFSLGLGAGSVLNIIIGALATAGAAQTVNSTNGNNGGIGSNTLIRIGTSGFVYISTANGGQGGLGGTTSGGTGGAAVTGQWSSVVAGSSSATAAAANVTAAQMTAGSGAAGGGISTANVAFAGGVGGRGYSTIDFIRASAGAAGSVGVAGGNGGFPANNSSLLGDGGGGGGGSVTGNGGDGGLGGGVGGAPGGGGAATDAVGNSGAGRAGVPGYAEITFY